jgi:hypothetical protein
MENWSPPNALEVSCRRLPAQSSLFCSELTGEDGVERFACQLHLLVSLRSVAPEGSAVHPGSPPRGRSNRGSSKAIRGGFSRGGSRVKRRFNWDVVPEARNRRSISSIVLRNDN